MNEPSHNIQKSLTGLQKKLELEIERREELEELHDKLWGVAAEMAINDDMTTLKHLLLKQIKTRRSIGIENSFEMDCCILEETLT